MIVGLNLLYLLPGVVGGTETYAAGLLHGLAQQGGADEFIVYLNNESADWPLPEDHRFHRVVCPVRAVSRIARYRYEQGRLPAQTRSHDLDLLHSLGYVAPLRLGCPSVVTVHDVHHLAYGRWQEWPRRVLLGQMVRHSVRRAAAVIAVSRFTRDAVARAYGIPADTIDVVWEAPNPRLNGAPRRGSDTMMPLQHDGPYLLAFGGVTPNKNLARLLRAFVLARGRQRVRHRLIVVGHLPASVRSQAPPGVVFTGYLDEAELARVLRNADALVFPSLYEGFGLPILEAMSAGVPVICSHAAAMPEVAGPAALYFDPRNVEDMAEKIGVVAREAALRSDLAARGRARAAAFSWDRAARETLAVYRRVLGSESSAGMTAAAREPT